LTHMQNDPPHISHNSTHLGSNVMAELRNKNNLLALWMHASRQLKDKSQL